MIFLFPFSSSSLSPLFFSNYWSDIVRPVRALATPLTGEPYYMQGPSQDFEIADHNLTSPSVPTRGSLRSNICYYYS